MDAERSITNVDEERIVSLVEQAEQRIVYLSPGTTENIARALARAWQQLGNDAVHVILDVDPEVCRMGYGTLEGLKTLRNAAHQLGTVVCHQPGVRIGLLIVDEITLVYSPTPLLLESGTTRPDRPNAIQLGQPPENVIRDVGLGERGLGDCFHELRLYEQAVFYYQKVTELESTHDLALKRQKLSKPKLFGLMRLFRKRDLQARWNQEYEKLKERLEPTQHDF